MLSLEWAGTVRGEASRVILGLAQSPQQLNPAGAVPRPIL